MAKKWKLATTNIFGRLGNVVEFLPQSLAVNFNWLILALKY